MVVVSKAVPVKTSSLTSSSDMQLTKSKSCEHDAISVDLLRWIVNKGDSLISSVTCFIASDGMHEVFLSVVSFEKEIYWIFFALASTKSRLTISTAQGSTSVSQMTWGFSLLGNLQRHFEGLLHACNIVLVKVSISISVLPFQTFHFFGKEHQYMLKLNWTAK